MPFTNAPEPSLDDYLNNTKERHFLYDYATLTADASEGITTVLDTIEANEHYQSRPEQFHADAHALAIGESGCKALQKLALMSARLPGHHAVQEVELIEARKSR